MNKLYGFKFMLKAVCLRDSKRFSVRVDSEISDFLHGFYVDGIEPLKRSKYCSENMFYEHPDGLLAGLMAPKCSWDEI